MALLFNTVHPIPSHPFLSQPQTLAHCTSLQTKENTTAFGSASSFRVGLGSLAATLALPNPRPQFHITLAGRTRPYTQYIQTRSTPYTTTPRTHITIHAHTHAYIHTQFYPICTLNLRQARRHQSPSPSPSLPGPWPHHPNPSSPPTPSSQTPVAALPVPSRRGPRAPRLDTAARLPPS